MHSFQPVLDIIHSRYLEYLFKNKRRCTVSDPSRQKLSLQHLKGVFGLLLAVITVAAGLLLIG